jgi:hypothetical protein
VSDQHGCGRLALGATRRLVWKDAEIRGRAGERHRTAHPTQIVRVQRVAGLGGNEACAAVVDSPSARTGGGGADRAAAAPPDIMAAGGETLAAGVAMVVAVDGSVSMDAGAVMVVVPGGAVPMSRGAVVMSGTMLMGTTVDATVTTVPVNGVRVTGITRHVVGMMMRVMIGDAVRQIDRMRVGVRSIPVRVAVLHQARGSHPDGESDGERQNGAADAARHSSAEEPEPSVHRTVMAVIDRRRVHAYQGAACDDKVHEGPMKTRCQGNSDGDNVLHSPNHPQSHDQHDHKRDHDHDLRAAPRDLHERERR